jgi:hypothetical protein
MDISISAKVTKSLSLTKKAFVKNHVEATGSCKE